MKNSFPRKIMHRGCNIMSNHKDTKRVLSKYSFYDRTHIQQYLEDMATKGWMLEKITSFHWQFKAI
ncbi:MAG: DUF2812 domain-containing protein, partial [Peptococcaceae bacterium]|nr:DUF2812 domain-containing protein [Peptococcaceae bacterium]